MNIFGGTTGALIRLNFHIIFSDKVTPEIIKSQFINALPNAYKLSPEYDFLKNEWQALSTKKSLIDLGERIIKSVPKEQVHAYESPLIEGFII